MFLFPNTVLLKKADFIISFGNSYNEMIPSKTLEIVGYRKPIVHFSQLESDASELYLRDYPMWCNIFIGNVVKDNTWSKTHIDKIVKELAAFVKNNGHRICEYNDVYQSYVKYTPEYFVKKILGFVEKL